MALTAFLFHHFHPAVSSGVVAFGGQAGIHQGPLDALEFAKQLISLDRVLTFLRLQFS
jgi:hypothetical protein